MKIITFIIPAYNSQNYLRKCLDSLLLGQNLLSKIEVLIINDGSEDMTSAVAQEYAEKYPEIFFLINKQNGGHGSAINMGIEAASGKYLKVVDADDWLIKDNLSEYLSDLAQCDADVILTPYQQIDVTAGKKIDWKMYCTEYRKILTLDDIIADWKSYGRCLTLPGVTYRTDFYKQLHIKLPEKIYYEDQEYVAFPCCKARSFYPININIYQYRIGNSEQSVAEKNRLSRISHAYQVIIDLIDFYKLHVELDMSAKEYLCKAIEASILSFYVVTLLIQPNKQKGRKEAKQFHEMLKDQFPIILGRIQLKYRIYVILNYFHISYGFSQKILRSRLYSIIRRSHRLEEKRI